VRSTTFLFTTLCTSIQLFGVTRVQTGAQENIRPAVPRRRTPRTYAAPYRGPRPQAPLTEARTVPRPRAPKPHALRPRAPRARSPSGMGVVPTVRHAYDAVPPVLVCATGGGRPPIRSTNSSSHRRALPLRLALAYGRTPCHAIPSRPSAPVEAAAASSGFQPAASPTKPSSTSPSPTKGARATPLLCPAATSPE
jgi:hypothetical protein